MTYYSMLLCYNLLSKKNYMEVYMNYFIYLFLLYYLPKYSRVSHTEFSEKLHFQTWAKDQ